MSFEIIAVVLAGVLIAAYFERKTLKADVVAAEAKFGAAAGAFENSLRAKESQIRAKIFTDAVKVVADIKGWEGSAVVTAKEVIAQFEARLKQIL